MIMPGDAEPVERCFERLPLAAFILAIAERRVHKNPE